MTKPNVTDERKAELKALGYAIEDMNEEHGSDFEGQFRWIRDLPGFEFDFQDGHTSFSAEEAWIVCDQYVSSQS